MSYILHNIQSKLKGSEKKMIQTCEGCKKEKDLCLSRDHWVCMYANCIVSLTKIQCPDCKIKSL